MNERSRLVEYLRGELVGPSRPLGDPTLVEFNGVTFSDAEPSRRGPLNWRPAADVDVEEVLYYDRETPFRKYGVGQLHPQGAAVLGPDAAAALEADRLGADLLPEELELPENSVRTPAAPSEGMDMDAEDEEFDISSPDVRRPSTIGISFCAELPGGSSVVVKLPRKHYFPWQASDSAPFPVNGRYEPCTRLLAGRTNAKHPMWRRVCAVGGGVEVAVSQEQLRSGRPVRLAVPLPDGSPISLSLECYARQLGGEGGRFVVTVVLRNRSDAGTTELLQKGTLFQAYFEVTVAGGALTEYPEGERPFETLDRDEQSLKLLYRDSAVWAIGHGCAAGWSVGHGRSPSFLFADVMPAVETPSMTPDVTDAEGSPIQLRMRDLASLADDGSGEAWARLRTLAAAYEHWIGCRRRDITELPPRLQDVGTRHLELCEEALARIKRGVGLLETDARVRSAFRLANIAMVLQQIATKRLSKRPLQWDAASGRPVPSGTSVSAWMSLMSGKDDDGLGSWRAFQIAFLLMQLEGMSDAKARDRSVVDLIWFPTGGGKTEAYLGVMAFYMFHERLLMAGHPEGLPRDGTNVFMRYTLRMLTTQQFQRAASLITAMEYLRRHPESHRDAQLPGNPFTLGLWIGGEGTPNKITWAKQQVEAFRSGRLKGNPLVITECPWCRAEIGRIEPPGKRSPQLVGITEARGDGPRLHCSDPICDYGKAEPESWLPVEVIDERIYSVRPSLIIATVDKFAVIAFRPDAGVLFGRELDSGGAEQRVMPPGLIIQDELHLIAGPLGTAYALYEGVVERLCSFPSGASTVRPKIIASTATIRGAEDQVRALYARVDGDGISLVRLFPSPGLTMGDSFFGTYARHADGSLEHGRLYLGIHAPNFGSVLTAQVRAFAAALCAPAAFDPSVRDPWWTLLTFYNSLRELGGARTLFDSDIRSRLKFLQNREGTTSEQRRNLRVVEELTSRLSQAEIVGMLDRLAATYDSGAPVIDACLASSIIEVGVDIDRLSLMGVVGQPKTTAQYIQVTGRVGRKWKQRPGLILMLYSPSRSRDRSHFEQFHSYHRRLYEQVEPTSATPFSAAAIERILGGVLILWARQHSTAAAGNWAAYREALADGMSLLSERCRVVLGETRSADSIAIMMHMRDELIKKWQSNPQEFERFPPDPEGEYLMLWSGQYATQAQQARGVTVQSSMRQVDRNAELRVTQAYSTRSD